MAAYIDLRTTEFTALNGIHMAQDTFVNFQNVFDGDVIVSVGGGNGKKINLRDQLGKLTVLPLD